VPIPSIFSAERLLRLYPRAWRERYGEEFIATIGNRPLHPQQVIDVVSGAIDAWLSADVWHATRPYGVSSHGERLMMLKSLTVCERARFRPTTRDSVIGAGVMILATFLFTWMGVAARRRGSPVMAEMLLGFAFPGSLTLSMPFWMMKGQPWKAQAVITGGTLAFLIAISYLATRL
jgi:hypothetical protein